jgi:hypothetical protein
VNYPPQRRDRAAALAARPSELGAPDRLPHPAGVDVSRWENVELAAEPLASSTLSAMVAVNVELGRAGSPSSTWRASGGAWRVGVAGNGGS